MTMNPYTSLSANWRRNTILTSPKICFTRPLRCRSPGQKIGIRLQWHFLKQKKPETQRSPGKKPKKHGPPTLPTFHRRPGDRRTREKPGGGAARKARPTGRQDQDSETSYTLRLHSLIRRAVDR